MRGNYFHILYLWLMVEKEKAVRIGKNYWAITIRLATTFLIVETLGITLSYVFFPGGPILAIALAINTLLGSFAIYRAGAGIGTVDIIQELLPEKKKDEIPTWYYVGQVARIVGAFLFLLALPLYFNFANRESYIGIIVPVVIGFFLCGFGAPETLTTPSKKK